MPPGALAVSPAGRSAARSAHPVVGRDAELRSLGDFVDQIPLGPTALVIEGEPGSGKTALWQAAVASAATRTRDMCVLRARPAGTDATVSYALLLDLFDEIPASAFAMLPSPQRAALDAALRRREAEVHVDPGTIAVAVLAVIRELSATAPLLLAIDDVHDADPAGMRVVEFVVRRLKAERVGLLLAHRSDTRAVASLRLADTFAADRLRILEAGPLSVGAIHRIIANRIGVALPRPLVVRVHAMTAGNPAFALEVARELVVRGLDGLGAATPLPVPGSVHEVVERRLARLDQNTRRVLAVAAQMERPTRERLRLFAHGDADAAVDAAVAADVLVLEPAGLSFSHPIVRAAAAHMLSAGERREVHRRLADLATDPEERADHLGLGTDEPDIAIAGALEAGAAVAARRGAPEAALRLHDRALRLTPQDDPALNRRRLALAHALSDAGDLARASGLLEAVLAPGAGAEPAIRCDAAILLATMRWFEADAESARQLLRPMLDDLATEPVLLARVHSRLAWLADDDIAEAALHADAALERLDPDADPAAYAFALLNRAVARVLAGGPPDEDAIRRGDALQAADQAADFSSLPGIWPKYADRFDESRAWLERDLARLRALGDEGSMGQTLGYLAELEAWTGNLGVARRHAEEGLELIRQLDQQGVLAVAIARLVLVDIIEGNEDAARDGLAEMRRLDSGVEDPWTHALVEQVTVFLALADGDPDAADRAGIEASRTTDRLGLVEPAMYRFHADHIEAIVELGDFDRAEALLDRFEARDRRFPRPWITATSARCRALLAAAQGDVIAAVGHLDRALTAHDRLDWPLERVRTLIVGVRILRRANQRKRAHRLAAEAARIADAIGARPWAARARAEASRLGLEHGDGVRLTPSERRMAELAAVGTTNREIAERLLVSPKTVEATLARAYAKLGIRSRAQLHARLAQEPTET